MAKVNAGFGNASLAQQYSGQPINPLTVGVDPTQYYQGLNDPNDLLARALALDHHPVYSIGQGVADVAGKLGAAYLEKKARQHEIQAQQQAYGALNDASTIAGNDDLARAMIGGQVNNVQGGQAQLPGGGGPSPMNPGMRNAQVSLPANMVGSSDPNAQPLTAQDRYGAAMGQLRQNPNQGLAEAFSGNIQQAAQAAQQPSFTGSLKPGESAYIQGRQVASQAALPESPVGKAARDLKNGDIDKQTYDSIFASETHTDPLSVAHLKQAQAETGLAGARMEMMKNGQLDDDAIEMRAQLAAAGDPSAYQGVPKGIYGSQSLAKIGDRAAQIAKSRAEASGATPDQMGAQQAQINAQNKAARSALGTTEKAAAQIEGAANRLDAVIPQALEASDNVSRLPWVPINRLTNFAKSQSSDPAYGKLDIAIQAVKTEYAQAMARTGQTTDLSRKHADDLIDSARDIPDLKARMKQMQAETAAVVGANQKTSNTVRSNIGTGGGGATPPAPSSGASGGWSITKVGG